MHLARQGQNSVAPISKSKLKPSNFDVDFGFLSSISKFGRYPSPNFDLEVRVTIVDIEVAKMIFDIKSHLLDFDT